MNTPNDFSISALRPHDMYQEELGDLRLWLTDDSLTRALTMTKQADCPTSDELTRLTYGDLPGERFDLICEHVESCEACLSRLSDLEDEPEPFASTFTGLRETDLESAREQMAIESQFGMSTIRGLLTASDPRQQMQATLEPPCQLGPYEIRRLIGHGGMGEVYEARHTRLDRLVALKVIRGYGCQRIWHRTEMPALLTKSVQDDSEPRGKMRFADEYLRGEPKTFGELATAKVHALAPRA